MGERRSPYDRGVLGEFSSPPLRLQPRQRPRRPRGARRLGMPSTPRSDVVDGQALGGFLVLLIERHPTRTRPTRDALPREAGQGGAGRVRLLAVTHSFSASRSRTKETKAARSVFSRSASASPSHTSFSFPTFCLLSRAIPIRARWTNPILSLSGVGNITSVCCCWGGSPARLPLPTAAVTTSVAVTAVGGTSTSLSSSIPRPQRESVRRPLAFVSAFMHKSAFSCPRLPSSETAPVATSVRPCLLCPHAVTV